MSEKEIEINGGKVLGFFLIVGLIIAGIILLFNSLYTIDSGERAVLLTWGKASDYSVKEGLHFKFPIVQEVIKFEVRTKKLQEAAAASSKDLQVVNTVMALNYHINPELVHEIYTNTGVGYEERIIKPSIQEATKAAMAEFKADELINKRAEVSLKAKELLSTRLSKYDIIVDDFNLINFDFSDKFDAAIEAKQEAEQNALKAENDLKQKQINAQVRVAEAEADAASKKAIADAEAYAITAVADADAYALRVVKEELRGANDLIEYKSIEKWNGQLPKFTGSGAIPMIQETLE